MTEAEEDDLIQSSMPLYFDHIFGTSIGFSQQILDRLSPARTLPSSHPFSSPPLPHSSTLPQHPVPAILESQGFRPQRANTGGEASTAEDESFEANCAPEDTPLHSPADSQHSIALFSSPENNEYENKASLQDRTVDHNTQRSVVPTDTLNTHSCKQEKSGTKTTQRKKQNRKRRHCEVECEYHCPSSCTVLRDCTAAERIVSVIAVVVQGQWGQSSCLMSDSHFPPHSQYSNGGSL